jgi:tRNA A-37 threonylcarbamoyl transferase component Bud32
VRELAERVYFGLCLLCGRLLRSAKYAKVRIVRHSGELEVRKRRAFYAPLLVWLGALPVWMLDAGVRVLPQREWEERERRLYRALRGASIRVDAGGVLVLPCLPGETLARLLEDPGLPPSTREEAIERAVVALAELHQHGFTHGDAMAENVMVDLDAGAARWFDFETIHEVSRSEAWRRADDVRALLATCLLRTPPEKLAKTSRHVLDVYADEEVTRFVAASFASVWRRPLFIYLSQAALSFERFREIGRLLTQQPTPRRAL